MWSFPGGYWSPNRYQQLYAYSTWRSCMKVWRVLFCKFTFGLVTARWKKHSLKGLWGGKSIVPIEWVWSWNWQSPRPQYWRVEADIFHHDHSIRFDWYHSPWQLGEVASLAQKTWIQSETLKKSWGTNEQIVICVSMCWELVIVITIPLHLARTPNRSFGVSTFAKRSNCGTVSSPTIVVLLILSSSKVPSKKKQ